VGPLTGLDICAGSGIGSATFEAIGLCRTICYVEIDPYCQRLLQQRMHDGWLHPAPLWDDIKTFDGRPWRGCVDFIFGGIPCQPWSCAGNRGGSADGRDLWPDFSRVVREVGSRFVLLENVPGLLSGDGGAQFGRILGDLAEAGYDAEWHMLGADDVGAPHRRKRVWVLAYAQHQSDAPERGECEVAAGTMPCGEPGRDRREKDAQWKVPIRSTWEGPGDVSDAIGQYDDAGGHGASEIRRQRSEETGIYRGSETLPNASCQQVGPAGQPRRCECMEDPHRDGGRTQVLSGEVDGAETDGPAGRSPGPGWWVAEPAVGRVASRVASRVDRLRTIGNGWVPHVACVIAGRIAELAEMIFGGD